MFTEGLDSNALRWVRESHQHTMTHHWKNDPIIGNGSRGLGIPPPQKFKSRIGVVPISRTIPISNDSESASDMDESSDTEVYGGRYSIDSSPQEEAFGQKIPNVTSTAASIGSRYMASVPRHIYYSSDAFSDLSSSCETVRQQLQQQQSKRAGMDQYTEEEEESAESGGSLEFAGQTWRSNGCVGVPSKGNYPVESYSRNVHVPFQEHVKATAEKDCHFDVPSAPPFHGCGTEISQAPDQIPVSRSCGTPDTVGSEGSTAKEEACPNANSGSNIPNQYGRGISIDAKAVPSSDSLSVRVPTFHASGQGPWHSVIAYDACVRLCLHSWARGCMEAPIFLENECALLRSSFGLQNILLQSEEELLAKRSLELVTEGAAPKPKRIIGKMKVQVRKVRMALDIPSGCSFSYLKSPSVNMESLRCRISNLQSSLSSGWGSLQKARALSHLPANSPFSRHSIAYVHASAQYVKQVSGLLKIGVTTLRNSSSYEAVQETYSCHMRLKSLTEEDGVRTQPGSGETHVFFSDSLGDDLIVEVYDSLGKSNGRVVAQLASIAEDPNDKFR